MSHLFVFILSCLAVWRVCHFIARDTGPFGFMWEIRQLIFKTSWFEAFFCVKCLSVWVSLPVSIVLFNDKPFLHWLAMSAVVMMLEALYGMLWSKPDLE